MTNAYDITHRLGGRWYGQYGTAACPVCQAEGRLDQTALGIRNGDAGLLLYCRKAGCSYHDIIRVVSTGSFPPPPIFPAMNATTSFDKSAIARRVWDAGVPIPRTLAEDYLFHRGILRLDADNLRFVAGCYHPSKQHLPALVAKVEGGSGFAIHRTFLEADGKGKAAVSPAKLMLGPVAGGAVQLAHGPGPLIVGEGIENVLSYQEWTDLRHEVGDTSCPLHQAQNIRSGNPSVWAALSTSGMKALRLPPMHGCLVIAADNDPAGLDAAYDLATRARHLGWVVFIDCPALADWNAQLMNAGMLT